MPEEREIKLPVGTDFVLPDLDAVVHGTHAVDRGTVELSATYWDTDDLRLLRAHLGLRHRSAPGEPGKWTLKAGSETVGHAVSREETDFAGPPDEPPREAAFPYVTLGETRIADFSTGTEQAEEHQLMLHAWSRQGGHKEAHLIAGALLQALDDAPLTLTDHRLVNFRFAVADIRREADGRTYHAAVRFRAVTEPV